MPTIRLIKHEAIPGCSSFEVRFEDGRPSVYFYFEDLPGRRLRPDLVDSENAASSLRCSAEWGYGHSQRTVAHGLEHSSLRFPEMIRIPVMLNVVLSSLSADSCLGNFADSSCRCRS